MAEPVSLALVKAQCRILDDESQDALLTAYIAAARDLVESHTGQLLIEREVTETIRAIGGTVTLTYWPVLSIVSVDEDMDEYRQRLLRRPARLLGNWSHNQDVTVTYLAGHADPATTNPKLVQAILMLVAHWYEQREAVGTVTAQVALSFEALCQSERSMSV